jgi:hypothetical protein
MLILGMAVSSFGYAQNHSTRINGATDSDIAIPDATVPPGQIDEAALAEVSQYLKVIGNTQWTGMQGTGTISQGEQAPLDAALSILGSNKFRLDVTTPRGLRSIRICDVTGVVQQDNGTKQTLPAATAKNGILAFPLLFSSTFPDPQTTLLDHGVVQIEGKSLHRITLREVVFPGDPATEKNDISVLDLYFDPGSHLLIKSAEHVRLDSNDRARYLRVTTYADYRQANGMSIPYQYSQTLNGQKQWTLNLTEVNLRPSMDASYFLF